MNLSDKVVVITGGSKGLGRALAEILVEKGSRVVLCSRDEDNLQKTANDLGVIAFQADVTNESDLLNVARKTVESFDRIDLWINNAGVWLPPRAIDQIDMNEVKNLFNVNVFGTIHGMRAAVNQMRKQGEGTIVNIISTTAFDGMNGSSGSIYVSSKYALRGLTNVTRTELEKSNIKLIGIYPGGIKTDMFNIEKPANIDQFMTVEEVAGKIVANMELNMPETELIIKRPGQAQGHEFK